ncbi:MAG: hypothetical protein HC902_15085 [Calothrix sp. SM1_5_4]|nr:hypothetical protein [Calothrix sp. SM1_5_4]
MTIAVRVRHHEDCMKVDLPTAKWMHEGGCVEVKVMPLGLSDLTQVWIYQAEGMASSEHRMSHLYNALSESDPRKKMGPLDRLSGEIKNLLQKTLDDAYLMSNMVPPQITHIKLIECEMTPKESK